MTASTILLYLALLLIATLTGPVIWNSIINGFIFGLLLIAALFSYNEATFLYLILTTSQSFKA